MPSNHAITCEPHAERLYENYWVFRLGAQIPGQIDILFRIISPRKVPILYGYIHNCICLHGYHMWEEAVLCILVL